ncbi:GDP-mannose 4,6-dehydratase [Salinimicrobium sp. TH3]|uniref:GDP-mannose 4,6-dehydratase n=1 Tax=Salinimicrobium sp. TH3 TaxID=2997342 RepID=UPI002273F8A8|nr:GDP-mannose 4,6-dehydratase [Salinimicrobium sp. TH3]MCY2687947.1 GDP-mannose 4,6-dehydratase [Salinimicrobium sp. TH3]
MKTALISGITGQDGAYLAQLLLSKGYRVVGLVRSTQNIKDIGLEYLQIRTQVRIVACDLTDLSQVITILRKYSPNEMYNLAAQSSVSLSFQQPIGTIQFNILSVLNILEAIRILNINVKFYQASSSEIFGATVLPINEESMIKPLSPYGISKAAAHLITKNYREAYGIYSCCGILFNHESYLRSNDFFVKKVILEAIKIKNGESKVLKVGNIDVKRDFGWSPKYVEAMYLMLQQQKPEEFVICSGYSISLRSIINYIFEFLDIPLDKVIIDQKLYRPTEITDIYGDSSKAKEILNWDYSITFYEVLNVLINEELNNSEDKSKGKLFPEAAKERF